MERLRKYLGPLAPGGLCVAFSGGVDSAVLLAAAVRAYGGEKVEAVTLHSPLHSPADPGRAKALAKELGAVHAVLELPDIPEAIRDNPSDRCYLCKKELFTRLRDYAARRGLAHLLDGTNADDLTEYRPGLRALRELDVHSPLAELGVSKAEVRALAREMGLPVAEKPASPCLATRFPYGARLTPEGMRRADVIERFVRQQGIETVRARIHGDTVRLEVPPDDFAWLLAVREELVRLCLRLGLLYMTMDLAGFRSGSMDAALPTGASRGVSGENPE